MTGLLQSAVTLYINGKCHTVSGQDVLQPLTDYLRYTVAETGTKVVCAEGDCGACSVLIGRADADFCKIDYKPLNGCIQYVYQLHGTHVITVEGLNADGDVNPVQESMMDCHGAQCGYCTPGFVVAMSQHVMQKQQTGCVLLTNTLDVKNALTGNLCRCTGYEAIIKAGCAVNPTKMPVLSKLYPEEALLQNLKMLTQQSVKIEADAQRVFIPVTLDEVFYLLKDHPEARLVTGGTDLHVLCNKRNLAPDVVVCLSQLNELNKIKVQDNTLCVGAKVTLANVEQFLNAEDLLPEVAQILHIFGSPQIKYAGTLVGNIANGSSIADTLPFLFVLNAEVELASLKGTRRVNINDFYTGYRATVMQANEVITGVFIPLPKANQTLNLYKVSRRMHLDISAFTAAFLMTLDADAGKIKSVTIAYGGVGPVVMRMKKTEAFLSGKPFTLETFEQAAEVVLQEVTPMDDVRGSKKYREQLAQNILLKYYTERASASYEVLA